MDTLDEGLLLHHILCRLPARALACLDCTSHQFHRPRPGELPHAASIVDEAARLLLSARDDRHLVPPAPGFTRLRILGELEDLSSPLSRTFSGGVHGHLDVASGGGPGGGADGEVDTAADASADTSCIITKTEGVGGAQRNIGGGWGFTLQADRSWATAVCRGAVMRAGTHYCEFTVLKDSGWGSGIIIGVCRADWVATADLRATHTDAGWGLSAATGILRHGGESREWPGQEYIRTGETLGLLVEFGERRLTAFKDGRRLGILPTADVGAAPLPVTADGAGWIGVDADGLFDAAAPLCWMIQLYYPKDSVIKPLTLAGHSKSPSIRLVGANVSFLRGG
jgi:hypothetical protein